MEKESVKISVDFIAEDKREREIFNTFLSKKKKKLEDYDKLVGLRFADDNGTFFYFLKRAAENNNKVVLCYGWKPGLRSSENIDGEILRHGLLNKWQRKRVYSIDSQSYASTLEGTFGVTGVPRHFNHYTVKNFLSKFKLQTDLDMLKNREALIDSAINVATRRFPTRSGI